ncbi:retention module-containing protein [Pseudomonas chlororaphis]|uniref:retention module-containing protein n=1 Tax=Pseudomonas chlororaphis TaxID=587753 RepID=UPI003BF7FA61
MARLIGVVSKVIGQVVAVAADGSRRVLVEGDRLFAGDQLVTGAQGAVAVHLQNGQELTLGRDSSLQLSPQLLANQAPHVQAPEVVTPSEAQLTDVEQLQKAIAAGADPTQTGEATAAGPGATGGPAGALGAGTPLYCLKKSRVGSSRSLVSPPRASTESPNSCLSGLPRYRLATTAVSHRHPHRTTRSPWAACRSPMAS